MSTQIKLPDASIIPGRQPAPAQEAGPTVTRIRPPQGWQPINFQELWQFRELIYFLTWRDIKVRYKQTVLGAAWAVLQPAMMMVVFTIFFGRVAGLSGGAGVSYPIFVLAAILPWTFFSTAISNASNSVVGSERLIAKIYFPRLAMPFAAVGAALVDFLVACGLLALMMVLYGVWPTPQLLLAPLLLAVILLASLGLGALLAALNVAYRDFRYVIPFFIQVGMFATPTIYTQPTAESSWAVQTLLLLNPMTSLIAAFRACILGGTIPWGPVGVAAVAATGLFVAGCLYFRRVEDNFADII